MVALRVVGLELGGPVEGFHGLLELSLAVVVTGDGVVDGRVVRVGLAGFLECLLSFLVPAGVLIDLGELEVRGGFLRVQLDHLLDHRLGCGRVVQLVGTVSRDEILQGTAPEGRVWQPLSGNPIILDCLVQVGIVVGFPLAAGLV